jgi:hypothetical protein
MHIYIYIYDKFVHIRTHMYTYMHSFRPFHTCKTHEESRAPSYAYIRIPTHTYIYTSPYCYTCRDTHNRKCPTASGCIHTHSYAYILIAAITIWFNYTFRDTHNRERPTASYLKLRKEKFRYFAYVCERLLCFRDCRECVVGKMTGQDRPTAVQTMRAWIYTVHVHTYVCSRSRVNCLIMHLDAHKSGYLLVHTCIFTCMYADYPPYMWFRNTYKCLYWHTCIYIYICIYIHIYVHIYAYIHIHMHTYPTGRHW